jgi:hypothetical protein
MHFHKILLLMVKEATIFFRDGLLLWPLKYSLSLFAFQVANIVSRFFPAHTVCVLPPIKIVSLIYM